MTKKEKLQNEIIGITNRISKNEYYLTVWSTNLQLAFYCKSDKIEYAERMIMYLEEERKDLKTIRNKLIKRLSNIEDNVYSKKFKRWFDKFKLWTRRKNKPEPIEKTEENKSSASVSTFNTDGCAASYGASYNPEGCAAIYGTSFSRDDIIICDSDSIIITKDCVVSNGNNIRSYGCNGNETTLKEK